MTLLSGVVLHRRVAQLSVLASVAVLAACGAVATVEKDRRVVSASGLPQTEGLSAEQLAGERVIFSYVGLAPPADLLAAIRRGDAGGVIFYGGNISSRAQITRVIGELDRAAAESPVPRPLLLMTDQEGGQVCRLPGAPVLSEKQIGTSGDPLAAAREAGRDAALNLKGVGMNVNLAPVLDVYRTPGDFIDRCGRSYGSDPGKDGQLGAAFIAAQHRSGVVATAKHFPGLGAASASQDTDIGPVTLNVPLDTLRSVDERPYRSAISAGVRLVMVSWATYPALDSRRPAGLSATVIGRELRQRMGFTGVTISDALEAGALRKFGGTSNRALLAAGAGVDLLLCASQNVSQGLTAVNALARSLGSGALNRTAFIASDTRVMALRSIVDGDAARHHV